MIAWSTTQLKFTAGIGTLCVTALLADISRQTIPVWLAMSAALLPVVIFLLVRPDEMPRWVVLPLQVFASVWYLVLAVILSVFYFRMSERTQGWPAYFIGLMIGCIPCVIILWRLLCSRRDQTK
jgi:hypothetical protein